jgi:hypothetical protein
VGVVADRVGAAVVAGSTVGGGAATETALARARSLAPVRARTLAPVAADDASAMAAIATRGPGAAVREAAAPVAAMATPVMRVVQAQTPQFQVQIYLKTQAP